MCGNARLCRVAGAGTWLATPELADRAMRHGYGWKWGPFELIDAYSARPGLAGRLRGTGRPVPPLLQRLVTRLKTPCNFSTEIAVRGVKQP